MAESWLHHITTTTGHSRRSPRSEVADDVLQVVRELLRRALAGERPALPGPPGYQLEASAEGDLLLATVFRGRAVPLATIGVARSDRDALRLWGYLRERGDVAPDRPPPAPWCAAVLQPALAVHRDAAAWLGDFERCLAWGWVEGDGG
jgi:hypothetical protein